MALRPGSKLGHIGGRQVLSLLWFQRNSSLVKKTVRFKPTQWKKKRKLISMNDLSDGTVTVILRSKDSPINYT